LANRKGQAMSRKNRNYTKGKNSGRKFDKRNKPEEFDGGEVFYQINEDARLFQGVRIPPTERWTA
jgi:hypothetical protein